MNKSYFNPNNRNYFVFRVFLFLFFLTILLFYRVKESVHFKRFCPWKTLKPAQPDVIRECNSNGFESKLLNYNLMEDTIGLKKLEISECTLGEYVIKSVYWTLFQYKGMRRQNRSSANTAHSRSLCYLNFYFISLVESFLSIGREKFPPFLGENGWSPLSGGKKGEILSQ
jgi:hypothetical protein